MGKTRLEAFSDGVVMDEIRSWLTRGQVFQGPDSTGTVCGRDFFIVCMALARDCNLYSGGSMVVFPDRRIEKPPRHGLKAG